MAILSVRFLWRAHSQGGFPHSVQHMAGEGHVQINWLKPCVPIVFNTEHVQFVDVLGSIVGDIQ